MTDQPRHEASWETIDRLSQELAATTARAIKAEAERDEARRQLQAMREVVEAARQVDTCNALVAKERARNYPDGVPASDYRLHLSPADLELHEKLAALSQSQEGR